MTETCARSGCVRRQEVEINGVWWCFVHAAAPAQTQEQPAVVTQCVWCGCGLAAGYVTREHVVPKSRGGRGPLNIAPACRRCNGLKGDKDAREFIEVLKAWGFR